MYNHNNEILTQNHESQSEEIKCNICDHSFTSKADFLRHRKLEHIEHVPICKTIKLGKQCRFSEEVCFYIHNNIILTKNHESQSEEINCKICDHIFTSMPDLLKHRKIEHIEHVPICRTIKLGKKCRFSEDECFYIHNKSNEPLMSTTNVNPKSIPPQENVPTQEDFCSSLPSSKPPEQMEDIKKMLHSIIKDIDHLKLTLKVQ